MDKSRREATKRKGIIMKINHNMPALRALRQLNKSETLLTDSLFKLSSGNRINRSSDDAAGLAIAHKLRLQLNGLSQSGNNAWDGISLIQTGEGALNEVHAILQRMRELSVQAANGTYIEEDRANINMEIEQLRDELNRLSKSIDFNGVKILDGELDLMGIFSDKTKMELLSIHESVEPNKFKMKITEIPTKSKISGGAVDLTQTMNQDGSFSVNGVTISYQNGDLKRDVFAKLQKQADFIGVTVEMDAGAISLTKRFYGDKELKISNGLAGSLEQLGLADGTNTGKNVKIDLLEGFAPGSTVKPSGDAFTIEGPNGFELRLKLKAGAALNDEVSLELLKEGPAMLQIGANYGHTMQVRIPNVSAEGLGMKDIFVGAQEDALDALARIEDAISLVSKIRSKLGAYQNRLEYTVANIDTSSLNMTEAHSRIMHIDMAQEMTEYTKQNVIQQAATALLAQANQKPQEILQLLR